MTTRVSVSLPDALADAIDAVCDEFSLARSRVVSDILGSHLEGDDLGAAVRDAIPDVTLRLAEKERQEEMMRKEQKLREKRASFVDRTRGYFRKRLEGDAAYEPREVRELAEGYKQDARIWHDDEDEANRKCAMVDEWLDWYEAGYWAREHAEQVETEVNTEDVSGWFEVGEDVYRLREHADDVAEHVRRVADNQNVGHDADAVIDSVARKWSVCRGAVHLVIESLTVEDSSVSDALTRGGERLRPPGETTALTGEQGVQNTDELPEDQTRETGETPTLTDDGTAHDAHARFVDDDRDDEEELDGVVLDDDEAAELLDDWEVNR